MDRERQAGEGRRRSRHDGPRLYLEGRYWKGDFRPWGGLRVSLRDPKAPGWPDSGERTTDPEVAALWARDYVDRYQDETQRTQLGRRRRIADLGAAVDAYLEHRRSSVAANTAGIDRTALQHLVDRFQRGAPLRRVADGLQDLADLRIREGYAASTVNTLITSWSPFFRWLGYSDEHNPARHLKRPATARADVETWSDDQLGLLRDAADWVDRHPKRGYMPQARLLVEVFLCTAAREQEGFALDWTGFRPEQEAVRFAWQLSRDGRGRQPLKGKRGRTTFVLPEFWEHYRADARGPVLCSPGGGYVGYRSQRNVISRILDAARLSDAGTGYHRFRHTYARIFLERGGRMEELRMFLGHTSIITTQDTYGHLHEDVAVRNARQRLGSGPRLVG
jgi:site-specific recombinase XerD